MRFLKFKSFILLLAVFTLILASCNDTTNPSDTVTLTSFTPVNPDVGDQLTLNGSGFGDEQGTNFVQFIGAKAISYTSWSDTKIVCAVPLGAVTGNVYVSVGGVNSGNLSITIGPPAPPTELVASSTDANTVALRWIVSASESNQLFDKYTLDISPGGFSTLTIDKGLNNFYALTGLNEGTVYTFTLKSRFTSSKTSAAITVQWSPASRFTKTNNNEDIMVYETASGYGSGLDLYYPADDAPRVLAVGSGADWNLGLDTRTNGQIKVASAGLLDYAFTGTPGVTQISDSYFPAGSLDEVFDSEALSVGNFSEQTVELNSLGATNGVVLIVRTIEPGNSLYTYAKVLIKKVGGAYLQETAPNRYLVCQVSYQKVAGVPYARPTH